MAPPLPHKVVKWVAQVQIFGWLKTPAKDGVKYSSFSTLLFGSLSALGLLFPTNFMRISRSGSTWFWDLFGTPAFLIPLILVGKVPHTTFLLTHVCFLFYHVSSNMTLRRIQHSIAHLPENTQWLFKAAWILALSYFIAYLETLAISNFPYYEFVDRASMYTVGSLFYAIYFFVSFPMFLRIDEKPGDRWDLPRVAIDALGAAMLVTIILDFMAYFSWSDCSDSRFQTMPSTRTAMVSGNA
ncbi:hypothetical protein DH2020_027864 [Rehmannia glutinosa]|uniref:Cycloeucalenol cycloisomerase n=1 Tax=Rehmannia glutinosa TaxID=99300 RepID=A0ABR0VVS7_REHGL